MKRPPRTEPPMFSRTAAQTASSVAFASLRIASGTRLQGIVLDDLCARSHADPGAYLLLRLAAQRGLLS